MRTQRVPAFSLLLVGGLILGCTGGQASPVRPSLAPTPCSSPYASDDVTIAVPRGEVTVPVEAHVGDHVVVGFAPCREAGSLRIQSGSSVLDVTDSSSRSKGGPAYAVRWRVIRTGTAEVHGVGDQGSRGTVVVNVNS